MSVVGLITSHHITSHHVKSHHITSHHITSQPCDCHHCDYCPKDRSHNTEHCPFGPFCTHCNTRGHLVRACPKVRMRASAHESRTHSLPGAHMHQLWYAWSQEGCVQNRHVMSRLGDQAPMMTSSHRVPLLQGNRPRRIQVPPARGNTGLLHVWWSWPRGSIV